MMKLTKVAAVIFMAAASVYSGQVIAANPRKPVNAADKSTTDVKVLDDQTDPFAATQPASQPSADSTSSDAIKSPPSPVQMHPDGTFSLNIIEGAGLVEQLRMIGLQAEMNIVPSKDVKSATLPAMDLYNVTPHEALDALLHSNGFDWREKGKFIYVYSAKELAEMEKANRVTKTEVFELHYIPAADAKVLITPVLSKDAGEIAVTAPAKSGIETGTGDSGGDAHEAEDMLVVTDYPEYIDKVRDVLKTIDKRPQQILVEATILSASLNENNAMGIDFNVVGGVDFSTLSNSLGFTNGQLNSAGTGSGTAAMGNNNVSSVGTGNTFSSLPNPGGLKVGLVTNNVSLFLSALEGVTDTTVLANPKILALNKQRGEVIVGKETGYITTTTTETTSTQTVQFLDTGTRLVFRPYIGDDGYIRMEVHPEDSDGGLQTSANLPFKSTTEVTTNIMVKDGHTVVIGGLFRESSSSTKSQIPVLGNLPLAGPLFRQQSDTTTRQELIILLTPHIVKDDDAFSQMSENQLKESEKMRVGVRKGMMFWGRERLAEMNYEWAVEEMNKPHPDRHKALWNLDAATNLNPRFIEAIDMKQNLTGKEITDSDNSSIRSFVSKAILMDQPPTTQPTAIDVPAQSPTTLPVAQTTTTATVQSVALNQVEPASQPATQPVAIAEPTTQPSENEVAIAPATQPTTQPVADDDKDDTETQDENATQVQTKITELPTETIPSAPAADQSK